MYFHVFWRCFVAILKNPYKKNNTAPNLKGKSLREAFRIANSVGMLLEPKGLIGKVVWQSVKPGEKINNNQMCKIRLGI